MCGDPTVTFYGGRTICYSTREREAVQAAFERLHEKAPWSNHDQTSWAEKPDATHPYHMTHGVTWWAATEDLAPDDDFLAPPAAQPAGGDEHDQ